VEAEWPSLWRVLQRAALAPAGATTLAVTLRREVQLHVVIAAPLIVRIRISGTGGSSIPVAPRPHVVRTLLRTARPHALAADVLGTNRAASAATTGWTSPPVRTRRISSSALTLPSARWIAAPANWHRSSDHIAADRRTAPRQVPGATLPRRFQARTAADQPQPEYAFSGPPRILGRPAAPNPAPHVALGADSQAFGQMSPRSWDDPAGSRPQNPIALPNIEQMTDQVLRTLDQRLVAARERLSKR
jgi:hypothetical protein